MATAERLPLVKHSSNATGYLYVYLWRPPGSSRAAVLEEEPPPGRLQSYAHTIGYCSTCIYMPPGGCSMVIPLAGRRRRQRRGGILRSGISPGRRLLEARPSLSYTHGQIAQTTDRPQEDLSQNV